jgi:hypothetical protein
MNLRKSANFCVERGLTATIDEKQHSLYPMVVARAANCSQNEPDESRTGRLTFIEDFLLEHSPIGLQADSIGFAGCF